MTSEERATILGYLRDEDFADLSVSQVFYRLLDKGVYVASESSWHRIARAGKLTGDRRRHATHQAKAIPELCAMRPNQAWSWDITVLKSVDRGRNFKLYLILDIFSRYVVGWRVEEREQSNLAVDMLATAIDHHATPEIFHADRGPSMTSDLMGAALQSHGITQSHSRPHVSNDNPFSESQFKTMKYDLDYPEKFDSLDHARSWTTAFIESYNTRHRHSGIGHYTPESVHDGTWTVFRNRRQHALDAAHARHPARYTRRPQAETISTNTWINNPAKRPKLSHPG